MDRPAPLSVVWEDAHGLVVVKPAGLLTQVGSDPAEPTLETLVRHHLRPDDPGAAYLGTVHRLDRPVSGVVLWAKTPKAARRWSAQFRDRSTRKEYWAMVAGRVGSQGQAGRWVDAIRPPDREGRAALGDSLSEPALPRAETAYEVVATSAEGWTRMILRPETGRTHQLRAQTAGRGHPIVGDRTYGSTVTFPAGIALHARSLTVVHPVSRVVMKWEAPLPPAWDGWWPAT